MHELEAAQLQLISPARAAAASHRVPLAAPAGGAVARRAALGAAALGAAAAEQDCSERRGEGGGAQGDPAGEQEGGEPDADEGRVITSGSEPAAESGEHSRTPSPTLPTRGGGWAEGGAAPLSDVEVSPSPRALALALEP
jgi:hypothetical protein